MTAWALCGKLWVPTGLCRVDVRSGKAVAVVAGTEFLCWGSVLVPCVVVPGMLLGVPSSLVVVTCVLPGVVPAHCVCPLRRCGAGDPGVGCVVGCWLVFASCRVLCVLF